jgi:hypothetical protein
MAQHATCSKEASSEPWQKCKAVQYAHLKWHSRWRSNSNGNGVSYYKLDRKAAKAAYDINMHVRAGEGRCDDDPSLSHSPPHATVTKTSSSSSAAIAILRTLLQQVDVDSFSESVLREEEEAR